MCIDVVLDFSSPRNSRKQDVKPGNVLLDGRGRVVLCDFDLAVTFAEAREESYVPGTR